MNPFDLTGPAFLGFFALLCAATLIAVVLARRSVEDGPMPKIDLADPYLIACLRGGRQEAVRVAVASLLDRRLLKLEDGVVSLGQERGAELAGHPLERAVCQVVAENPRPVTSLIDHGNLGSECAELERTLTAADLLPSERTRWLRDRIALWAVLFVVGVTATKVVIALSRGRSNLFFLLVATVLAVFAIYRVARPRLTRRGRRMIDDARTLYARLRERTSSIRPGGVTHELALVAGVFGLATLPTAVFPYASELTRRPASAGSDSGGWFGGSSGCSSCGGGCGGGCGGCGG